MVLYTPGYKFFVVNNMEATLTCNWTDELGRAPGQVYPLILSHADAAEEHFTYLSVPPSDQLTVNRSFYSTSYTFTVIRSDHLTKFKCIAFVNAILEEKCITIFIRSGPAIPILQGPSTVPTGDQGEWTCTSDCATHEFPEVSVSLSLQYDYWDQCPQCLEVTRDVYDDIYGVKTFKVVVKVSGMLPSREPGDVFYLQCRSVYNPFPASSRTLYSTPFSVNVSTAIIHTTETIANTAIDTARTDTPDNDKKDDDDEKKPSGGISSVVLAWTIPLALLLVIVVAAICICVQRHWSTRKTNIILSEAEIELNRIPSIFDQVKHSERLGKKDVYTALASSSIGDQSDSQGLSGSLTSNGGRLYDDETTLDSTMSSDETYTTSTHSVPQTSTVSGLYPFHEGRQYYDATPHDGVRPYDDAVFLMDAGSHVDPTPRHKHLLPADLSADHIFKPYLQTTIQDTSFSQSEDTTGGSGSDHWQS